MSYAQILRRISGLAAVPGDIVDTSEWAPNRLDSLIKQRRCVLVMNPAASAPATRKGQHDEARHSR